MTQPTRENVLARIRRGGLGLVLCLTSIGSAQLAPTAPATAASTNNEDEPVQLQALTVTGSNLRRLDFEKTLPVTLLGRDEIELRDAPQAADLLASLPQVTGLPGNETATLGATAALRPPTRSCS
jgi:outer membrane receptor protein involved in Fe transport